jgi:hypothetical protein
VLQKKRCDILCLENFIFDSDATTTSLLLSADHTLSCDDESQNKSNEAIRPFVTPLALRKLLFTAEFSMLRMLICSASFIHAAASKLTKKQH